MSNKPELLWGLYLKLRFRKKIQDEIIQRVIDESDNLKEEKERLEIEKITCETIAEMSDLPMEYINKIASPSSVCSIAESVALISRYENSRQ